MSLEVWVRDSRTGLVDETFVADGEHLVLVAEPAYIDQEREFANGTAVITVKGRTAPAIAPVVPVREELAAAAAVGRKMAEASAAEPDKLPALHAYWCNTCWAYTVTIQLDEGRVPDKISCRAQGFAVCPGDAHLHKQELGAVLQPKWEWVAGVSRSVPSDENAAVALAARSALILQPFGTRRGDVL